jgi:hypothetical protein
MPNFLMRLPAVIGRKQVTMAGLQKLNHKKSRIGWKPDWLLAEDFLL